MTLEFKSLTISLVFDIFMLDNGGGGGGVMVHVIISFVDYVQ